MLRRLLPLATVVFLGTLILLAIFQTGSWRRSYGPSEEEITSGINIRPDLRTIPPKLKPPPANARYGFQEPGLDIGSPYPSGKLKLAGSNYSRALVLASMKQIDTGWVEVELGDMISSGLLTPAIYVADDPSAPLHPPKNKGHEAMVYFTYIIDHYDELPDISIFMHGQRSAWHNNALLDTDSALMVRHLSPERVTRDGYMNLRCHWDPGCPTWLHPGAVERNPEKQEEWLVAEAWAELFPLDPIPTVLAQPCCAQFAVSAERIRALPKQRYIHMRDWLLRTHLSDYLSGRVFEYIWQYLFTLSPFHCPSMSACYCDGYGICFGSTKALEDYFQLGQDCEEYKVELAAWQGKADFIEAWKQQSKDGVVAEEADVEVPQIGRDLWLREQMKQLSAEMDSRRQAAFELGKQPRQRALESGREWHDGDGF